MKIERLCNREVTLAYENERIDEIARRMRERLTPRRGAPAH